MTNLDPIVFRELPVIQKIIADETWLEGERRGTAVSSDDAIVREHVCEVVLGIGERLREFFQAQIAAQAEELIASDHSNAA